LSDQGGFAAPQKTSDECNWNGARQGVSKKRLVPVGPAYRTHQGVSLLVID